MRFSPLILLICSILAVAHLASADSEVRTTVDWQDCRRWDVGGTTIPFDSDGKFYPECAPEVVYAWKAQSTLKQMTDAMKKGRGPVASHPKKILYASRTPLMTHAYGDVAVRIKLKKGVEFIFANLEDRVFQREEDGRYGILGQSTPVRNCDYYRKNYPDRIKNLVLVSYLPRYKDFTEYIFCDDGPIHSWSYGTSLHLQEARNEKLYTEKNDDYEMALSEMGLTNEESDKIKDRRDRMNTCPDGYRCSAKDLRRRLQVHADSVKKKTGQIFYMPGVEKKPLDHFWTSKQFYYSLTDKDLSILNP